MYIYICTHLQVELRAFCSRHSEFSHDRNTPQLREPFMAVSNDSSVANHIPATLSMDKQHKLNIGRNGDNITVHRETPDTNFDKSGDGELRETGFSNSRVNAMPLSECGVDQLINMGLFQRSDNEDAKPSDSLNLALILKKVCKKIICAHLRAWVLICTCTQVIYAYMN